MNKRKPTGLQYRGDKWRMSVRLHTGPGGLKVSPWGTEPIEELKDWRAKQITDYGGGGPVPAAGSFAADVETYLSRVAAMPTLQDRTRELHWWTAQLGGTRRRRTITPAEIDVALQELLLKGLSPHTVRRYRTALQSLFVKLDGKAATNPVKASANPKVPGEETRGLDYPTIERLLASMPDTRTNTRDRTPIASTAKIVLTVMAYTGIPPGLMQKIQPSDLRLTVGTVRVQARKKGRGTRIITLPLTVEGRQAFQRFHEANTYGAFAVGAVNKAFKRAAARIGLDPATVHAYDLRHSFGMELYRVTRDLATVARFLGHTPGSPITARYAKGANADVDVSAAQAFSDARVIEKRELLKTAIAAKPVQKLPGKVTKNRNASTRKHLRSA